jgi:hypothetical protein
MKLRVMRSGRRAVARFAAACSTALAGMGAIGAALRRRANWRQILRRGNETTDDETLARQLTRHLATLNDSERDTLSRAVAVLWEAFLSRFRSLDGFKRLTDADHRAYLETLSEAAANFEVHRHSAHGHYYYAVELIRRYAMNQLHQGSEPEIVLGVQTGRLIERGQMIVRDEQKASSPTAANVPPEAPPTAGEDYDAAPKALLGEAEEYRLPAARIGARLRVIS